MIGMHRSMSVGGATLKKQTRRAKSDRKIWEQRSKEAVHRVLHLDAHIVGVGRNQFNPVFGTGGNIGKRDLATACKKAKELILRDKTKRKAQDWLKYTLWAEGKPELPELSSTGTWFVYANKTFNSGQDWSEEGKISPWSFLLALEGALLLVGSVNRRLSSISRPYAVFPFVTDRPSPKTEGEVGLARAEFWAPLWEYPATLIEIRALLERGLARIGNRDCRAPHEFALAARAAGVDAGVKEFARFVLRQTTSSQVYEAIPQEHIEVSPAVTLESELIEPLLPWLDRLPYEPSDSKQRGKFKGLRGPVEEAIVKIAERPDDTERWQQLLLLLADVQTRIDRNQSLRKSCAAVPRLSWHWFDKAWGNLSRRPKLVSRALSLPSAPTQTCPFCAISSVFILTKGVSLSSQPSAHNLLSGITAMSFRCWLTSSKDDLWTWSRQKSCLLRRAIFATLLKSKRFSKAPSIGR
jgi:CRISPR-associated protein Csx17